MEKKVVVLSQQIVMVKKFVWMSRILLVCLFGFSTGLRSFMCFFTAAIPIFDRDIFPLFANFARKVIYIIWITSIYRKNPLRHLRKELRPHSELYLVLPCLFRRLVLDSNYSPKTKKGNMYRVATPFVYHVHVHIHNGKSSTDIFFSYNRKIPRQYHVPRFPLTTPGFAGFPYR